MISGRARAEAAQRVSPWLCQTGMEPRLSAQLGQMDPHSFTTVSAACFMSPAVLISYTLFNSSPYNIHFWKSGVTELLTKLSLERAPRSCFVEI